MKIAFASDIHGKWLAVQWPQADTLCLAGDILANYVSSSGCDIETAAQTQELEAMLQFLRPKYKNIIIVSGNHDWLFFRHHSKNKARDICAKYKAHYLEDSSVVIDGLTFYGSPWQPWFYGWAFNFPRPSEGQARAMSVAVTTWDNIPDDVDVLITHGPPRDFLDLTYHGERVGCPYLKNAVLQLAKQKLKIHAFGHIHFSAGKQVDSGLTFINAAVLGEDYMLAKVPQVEEI